jgi:hypothetical protein
VALGENGRLIASHFNILMNLFIEIKTTSMKIWETVYKWGGFQGWKPQIYTSLEDKFRRSQAKETLYDSKFYEDSLMIIPNWPSTLFID